MAESERTRVRERGPVQENSYERFIRFRKEFDDRQLNGPVVIKSSDRQYETSRQGRILYYLDRLTYKDVPLLDWYVFTHDVRQHSGKHRHQGGLVLYIIEGTGYSIVDDERVDWETGDLLLLPIKPRGVEHQHFNAEPGKPCHWVAFKYLPIMDYVAMEFTHMGVVSSEFKG
jgi:quercetin dioxygenase-like cupin family protein